MDQDFWCEVNPQAADARSRGLLRPQPGDLPDLLGGWCGPRPLRISGGGTSSRAAATGQWTLDLRGSFKQIVWNPDDQTVRFGAGCRMGEVLEALLPHGRTIPAGLSGRPGSGYVLTGGMGPLSRRLGLAVDQVLAFSGVWGGGQPFALSRDLNQGTAEWRGLCGAAPFLAVVSELVLTTHPLEPLWIERSGGGPDQLVDRMAAAEAADSDRSLQWHWGADAELQFLWVSGAEQQGLERIDGLHQLPSLAPSPPGSPRLHGEVVGLLGGAGAEKWRPLLAGLQTLMAQRPHAGCNVACQQLGGATSRIPVETTSFVHRDAVWKPWITAVWPAGDLDARQKSLAWLEQVWQLLNPVCPGVHLAQIHDHLPFHHQELEQAFGAWLPRLRSLKARLDPEGNLPTL